MSTNILCTVLQYAIIIYTLYILSVAYIIWHYNNLGFRKKVYYRIAVHAVSIEEYNYAPRRSRTRDTVKLTVCVYLPGASYSFWWLSSITIKNEHSRHACVDIINYSGHDNFWP